MPGTLARTSRAEHRRGLLTRSLLSALLFTAGPHWASAQPVGPPVLHHASEQSNSDEEETAAPAKVRAGVPEDIANPAPALEAEQPGSDGQVPRYAPNRIIVRLKERNVATALAAPYSKRRLQHQATLRNLARDHKLKLRSPVFETLHGQLDRGLRSGQDLSVNALNQEIAGRFQRRARRMPRGDRAVDLLPVYLLETLDPNVDILAKCPW